MLPEEIEVWYILPAIRRALALEIKAQGISQKQIAKLLGVTEAAVSQYLSKKRAVDVKFDRKTLGQIKDSAKKVSKSKDERMLLTEIRLIMKTAMKQKIICKVHGKISHVPKNCNVCIGG